jgi:hypothetical protein
MVALIAFAQPSMAVSKGVSSKAATELRVTMRKLWEDHITYTRNNIISALTDLPDADATSKRLLKNEDEIGNAIKPYYGMKPATNWRYYFAITF